MGSSNKPKGRKRPKRWHRGRGELDSFDEAMASWPEDLDAGGDPTEGEPSPMRRGTGPSGIHHDS